jgi:hypothetical protein
MRRLCTIAASRNCSSGYGRQARSFERHRRDGANARGALAVDGVRRAPTQAHDREFAAGRIALSHGNAHDVERRARVRSGRFNTFDYTRGRDLWEKVPPFDYDVPTAGWALSNAAWSASH